MGRLKDRFRLMAMWAGIGLMMPNEYHEKDQEMPNKKTLKQHRKDWNARKDARKKRQGMSEFNIEGYKIWALNHKNALRKYRNLMKDANTPKNK